jgi:CHAT domain-containing protein
LVKLEVREDDAKSLGVDAGPLTVERLKSVLVNEENVGVLQQLADPSTAHKAYDKLAALWRLLAPEQERADDGFLTLPEIYELELDGCELVILSACRTNYGLRQRGEGVWTLSRGFLAAGAQRVAASNWLVDDEAAASLVSYFCSLVVRGQSGPDGVSYAQALHEAKRWVRSQEKWKSPYYWGAFVLVGPE